MGFKDNLQTVSQGRKQLAGQDALFKLLNTPRYDKHVKKIRDPNPHGVKGSKSIFNKQEPKRVAAQPNQKAVGGPTPWSAQNRVPLDQYDPGGQSKLTQDPNYYASQSVGSSDGLGLTDDAPFQSFLNSIAQQESGGNYSAVGVPTSSGTALGKYQVLDSNIDGNAGWDQEVLGRNISSQEFLQSPELQEKIAQAKLAAYYKDYGAAGAAKAWYGGPGAVSRDSDRQEYGGPSLNGYADAIIKRMR